MSARLSRPAAVPAAGSLVVLALLVPTLFSASACVSQASHEEAVNAYALAQRNIAEMDDHIRLLDGENSRLRSRLRDLEKQAVDAEWLKNQTDRIKRLLGELDSEGKPTGIPGVEVISTAEGIGFKIEGEVLFAKGKAEITTQGRATLDRLIPVLRDEAEQRLVRVDGHTDSDPIQRSSWHTNLRLSAERSLAVVDYLVSKNLPDARLVMAAFGPNRPRNPATTETAKTENRRVEIFLLNKS